MQFLNKLILPVLSLIWMTSSCNSGAVYEGKEDFRNRSWPNSRAVLFEFEIEDTAQRYDMYFHVRYTNQYPYQNLYIKHYLEDSSGRLIDEKLNNIQLFHPVTGVPLGSGMGDIFSIEKAFAEDVQFDSPGIYQLQMDHFMRMDTLPEVVSAGYRIRRSGES